MRRHCFRRETGSKNPLGGRWKLVAAAKGAANAMLPGGVFSETMDQITDPKNVYNSPNANFLRFTY